VTAFGYGAPVCVRFLPAVGLAALSWFASAPAWGQVAVATASKVEAGETGARRHFEAALELYRAGHYAEALTELEQAAKLDPNGKDLFFNLALVHEKLGQLPEAVAALERFRELETDRAERERARMTIERLRGAEQAAETSQGARLSNPPCPEPLAAPPQSKLPPNPVLVGAASVAAVSFVVGVVFGAKAWSDDVKHEETSPSLSVTQLRERGRRAEREALVADLAFAVSAASAATFVSVWLLSPKDPQARSAGVTLQGYF
jgi:tetratricopeptide (TPR) repeat protein